jgi:hypothetical protein
MEHADELAQEVVNAWAANMQADNAGSLTDDFKALFDKACRYRHAKGDNQRQSNMLREPDRAEEEAKRRAFAEAYKAFDEKHGSL